MKIKLFFMMLLVISPALFPKVVLKGDIDKFRHIQAQPGQTVTREIWLHNPSEFFADFVIYALDYDGRKLLPIGSVKRSLTEWLSLNSQRVVLDPGADFKLSVTIRVPPSELAGSYWTLICIEEIGAHKKPGEALGVNVKTRIALLQILNIENTLQADIEVKGQAVKDGVLSFRVHNTGNKYLKPRVSLELGQERLHAEQQSIFPGSWAEYKVSVPPGNHKALLIVDNGEAELWASRLEFGVRAPGGELTPQAKRGTKGL